MDSTSLCDMLVTQARTGLNGLLYTDQREVCGKQQSQLKKNEKHSAKKQNTFSPRSVVIF